MTIGNSGSGPLTVNSIASSNARFITVPPALPLAIAAGQSADITVRFAPSASGAVSGVLTIANNDPTNPTLGVPLSGTGAGTTSSCTYSLSVTSVNVPGGSSTISVGVTASDSACGWTATSNASWITIGSGSPGTGSGCLSFSISANPASAARMGTLTIAGIVFPVTQAASSQ